MARRGLLASGERSRVVVLLLAVSLLLASPTYATLRYGDVEFSGSFETQNLTRVPSPENFQFIQNRNTFRFRLDYNWFKDGKLIDRWELPFIKTSKLYLLYRGVYDGFYDLAPNDSQRGISRFDDRVGGGIEGNRVGTLRRGCTPDEANNPGGCLREGAYSRYDEQRNITKRDNELREIYIDLALKDVPVSFRIGRQQVIWGESDQFRMMDIWNPLDLRWHLQQEPFTEIREPLWMIKGLWDMPGFELPLIGQMSNVFFEGVWNPFDYKPGLIVDFLPRPWAAPFPNPLRAGQVQVVADELSGFVSPEFNLRGTSFTKGDFQKNPLEASGVGGRFHAVTEQGLEFTINYVYHRGRGIGAAASNSFGLKLDDVVVDLANTSDENLVGQYNRETGQFDPAFFEGQRVFRARANGEILHPYIHIFGFTANYFEGDVTQTVFRLETAYAMDVPYICSALRVINEGTEENPLINPIPNRGPNEDGSAYEPPGPYGGDFSGCRPPIRSGSAAENRYAPGLTKRDVWAGMLGFDRPTWIRWLNPKTTWFLTGQFFFSYINGEVPSLRGANITAAENPYFSPSDPDIFPDALIGNAGVGRWGTGPYAGITERVQNASFLGVNSDSVHRWESLITFAALSFYKGGSIMPFIAMAFDPVNLSYLAQPHISYFYTNNFIIRLGGKFYTDFGRETVLDPWGAGGLNNRRDEIDVRFTLQF